MANRYYVARGEQEYGPFTSADLRAMAARGKIEPTDAIWPEGSDQRIPAARVKHLFPESTEPAMEPAPNDPVGDDSGSSETAYMSGDGSEDTSTMPAVEPPPFAEEAPPKPAVKERPKRVISIKGGILCSQDGKHVQFKGKCTKCGYEAQGRSTLAIRQGPMKVNFFCRKCRKGRLIEMVGIN
jgi:hypothetical protein